VVVPSYYEQRSAANWSRFLRHPRRARRRAHDDLDRLLQYGDLTYTYTDAGQLATKTDTSTGELTEYTCDEFGNLERVALPGSQGTIRYPTDSSHRRIGRVVEDTQGNVTDERYWV
jgi:hypothetical protein